MFWQEGGHRRIGPHRGRTGFAYPFSGATIFEPEPQSNGPKSQWAGFMPATGEWKETIRAPMRLPT